ncbi:DUF5666 domain-containing protein [Novosphingobium mathurense]|uniref:Bacterial OB-fold domain-containing protein n=1 Tax=Novosphingobium mathurense TaxID=428990 RepID=A0A1U6INK4_9SPHN|nr:DUF5666 domain-containing protein [Novosphingobium mathurense]SLK09580.1 hypothetical protein SAMN06295987_11018 [Novosphingobium mathurense]
MFNKILISVTALTALSLSFSAAAQTPTTAYDGEWLSVSGTVQSVSGDNFVLDYGEKTIPVEMDDYDWYDENKLVVGDQVSVTGRMDDDFFQSRRIEASSVYVDDLHTLFYASADDEEDAVVPVVDYDVLRTGGLTLTGKVQSINGDEFQLDTGLFNYRVDTDKLYYDPFDDTGIQHITVGDRVSVTGTMDSADLFDRREIDATALTELSS